MSATPLHFQLILARPAMLHPKPSWLTVAPPPHSHDAHQTFRPD
jgi:hypothetical protein